MEKVVDPEDGVAPRGRRCPATSSPARPAPPSASTTTCGVLRRQHLGLLRRLRAGRRRPLHGLRRGPRTQGRRGRRLDRRPGVLPDHGLRPGPLRRRADQRQAVAPARRVVTRYPRPVHEPESATRPQQSPSTPATELADWLSAHDRRAPCTATSAVAVSGISLSTARVRPGDLYAALPGARAHGADFAAQALAAGAVVVLTDAGGPGPAAAGHARPRRDRAAPRARAPRRADLRRPRRRPARHRRHRHPGQDHHHPRARAGAHRGRRDLGRHRHRRHPDRGRGRQDPAHHARGAGPARPLRGDARARRRHLRDGGLQPRARARSGRRRRLRRRDLPQPRARPPRLPRRPRRLLRRQGRPLHPRAGPGRADQRRRRVRPSAPRRRRHPDVDVLLPRCRRRLAGGRRRPHGRAARASRSSAPTSSCGTEIHVPGEFNVSNALAAIASAALAGLDPRQVADGIARVGGVPGPARAGLRRSGLHRGRRLRPQARRPRGGPRHPATADRRPGHRRGRRRR